MICCKLHVVHVCIYIYTYIHARCISNSWGIFQFRFAPNVNLLLSRLSQVHGNKENVTR